MWPKREIEGDGRRDRVDGRGGDIQSQRTEPVFKERHIALLASGL